MGADRAPRRDLDLLIHDFQAELGGLLCKGCLFFVRGISGVVCAPNDDEIFRIQLIDLDKSTVTFIKFGGN